LTEYTRPATWEDLKTLVGYLQDAVRILDLPGLLKTKQGLRPKDRTDAAVISAAIEAAGHKPW